NVIDVTYVQEATGHQVEVTKVEEVNDPAQAVEVRQQNTIVAVTAPLAEPKPDAAPKKVVQTTEIKAPTKGQDIQATTGSIKPAQQNQTGEAAPGTGQATGGQQATGTQGTTGTQKPQAARPNAETHQNAAKGTSGQEPGTTATGQTRKPQLQQGANAPAQGENGQAAGKPEEKAAKGAAEQPGTVKPKKGQAAASQNEAQ